MIYLKNNTETQAIYIPRQTVLGGGYIPSTKAYEKGYRDGLEDGKEQQKEKLSNLYVTENGQYEREDGWNVVNVDVPDLNGSYNEGYEQGKTDGANEQKSKLESISIIENGTYNKEDGYNHIEVNVPDLNGSYNEGYSQGHTEGYNEGKTDGVNEQKSKLETIEITQNGTYNRGDGYNKIIVKVPDLNGSYDEGYEQGQADIATNAKVLNVTENGVYKTKFSDPIMPTTVTGVYGDGTKFYNYAELGNKVYNTNITVTQDSVVELWYKGDNETINDGWNTIFSCTKVSDDDFYLGYMWSDNTNLISYLGQKEIQFSWDDNVWHHIIMKNDGLWIDDVLIGSFNTTKTFAYKLGLNSDWDWVGRHANGCFGMIKIDDVVIIPTADGFKNVNTGELLEVVKNGTYTFTKNLPTYGEGEIYKTINVNVSYNLEDKQITPSTNDVDDNGYIVINPDNGYDAMSRVSINVSTIKSEWTTIGKNSITDYDITAFTYKVYDWTSVNINRNNMTNDCGDRPLDCLLFRNRSGECTVMTKLDNCSGTARLENGWSGDSIILSLKSNSITKFSSNSINSNQLKSIDTGFAKLEGNAITNCNALTDIKVTVLNNDLSTQFATNCFNGLPAEGTITIGKNVDVTITDDEITSFFRTIVGEGWTITIK